MAIAGKEIIFYRGSSATLKVTIKDKATKALVNITGGKIFFTLKRSIESGSDAVRKTSDNASEAVLTDPTNGVAEIYLTPSDTLTLEASRDYTYDVWVELASGKRYPVIKPSQWDLRRAATEDFS